MKEKRKEQKEKRTEAEENLPAGITRFPTPLPGSSASSFALSSKSLPEVTTQIASLLNLPVSRELQEVVQEFLPVAPLSLAGEAIEATAWITDARRNRTQQPMTPAFFRRWLRRTQQGSHTSVLPHPAEGEKNRSHAQGSLSGQDQYAVYVNRLIEQYNGPEALQGVI